MKAVKTIVATAVIVFALTTVAAAGIQRFGGAGETASASPAPAAQATRQGDSVTLSAQQFTALLHAVARDRGQDRTHTASRASAATHTHARTQTHAHAQTHTHASTQARQTTQMHHVETHHTVAHTSSHDGDSVHTASHDDGGHAGGCD